MGDDYECGVGRVGDARHFRVEAAGECLLASVGDPDRGVRSVAGLLPREVDRVAVVMSAAHLHLLPELARNLSRLVPARWPAVRLVVANAALSRGGAAPPAQGLAEWLGVEVIAPAGELLWVPGGSLFVVGGAPSSASAPTIRREWWSFRPRQRSVPMGRRFPEPEWERDVAAVVTAEFDDVVVDEIPAGLWLRRPGPVEPTDLAFAIPAQPSSVTLLVSRPGQPPLPEATVRNVVGVVADAVRDRLVAVPYGDLPVTGEPLGAIVSTVTVRESRVSTGLPLDTPGEARCVVAVGADGVPTWRPFALEFNWHPHHGPQVCNWIAPSDRLLPLGPGQWALDDRWLIEVVAAGFWVRQVHSLAGASMIRQLPLDSQFCSVIVGGLDLNAGSPPLRGMVQFLRQLPPDAHSRLRVASALGASPEMTRALAKIRAKVGAGAAWVLTDDGRLERAAEQIGQHGADRRLLRPISDRDWFGQRYYIDGLQQLTPDETAQHVPQAHLPRDSWSAGEHTSAPTSPPWRTNREPGWETRRSSPDTALDDAFASMWMDVNDVAPPAAAARWSADVFSSDVPIGPLSRPRMRAAAKNAALREAAAESRLGADDRFRDGYGDGSSDPELEYFASLRSDAPDDAYGDANRWIMPADSYYAQDDMQWYSEDPARRSDL
jgi:hypothetical protein